MAKEDKLVYEPPRIVDHGDLVELTAGVPGCGHWDVVKGRHGCLPPKFS